MRPRLFIGEPTESTARRLHRLVEPIHRVTYFSDDPTDALMALGHRNYWVGYFAGRAAPLGRVPAEVVHAIFYNFADGEVARTIAFSSSGIHERDRGIELTGDLTIRGVTLEVTMDTEFLGVDQTGLQGGARIGFTGRTTVHRSDFGVGSASIEANKVVVGDAVAVEIDIEAYLDQPPGGDAETVS